jgi:hypothetical protein
MIYDSENNTIGINYKNKVGQTFLYISDEDFVLPELKTGINGKLVVVPEVGKPTKEAMANKDYKSSWAVYMKKDDNNGLGTLSIPSLRLNLNLNKIHGNVIK